NRVDSELVIEMEKKEKYWREGIMNFKIIFKNIENKIVEDVKSATYYSIIIDSTPDIAHRDQLTFILRYVASSGKVVERFLGYIPIDRHNAAYLEKEVLN
uniref:DUF4371 domain-containing protein n=1 Tax=Anopheles funestus TaxID=62324 RepID=A0A182RXX3_ANOFN